MVRTIGDPDIRFREDPIRILRAVKFAARCNLTIEPETYRRMMEHRGDIAKCAQARVSEEFYRLLRAGAAKRSMEILLEAELLELLAPELARALRDDPNAEPRRPTRPSWRSSSGGARDCGRTWRALDRSTARRTVPPTNSLLLAVLMLPPLRDALDPDSTGVGDIGQLVSQSIQPVLERLRASRRDGELARQILLAIRYILPSKNPRRKRPRLAGREFFDEALRLCEIVSDAESLDASLAGQPLVGRGSRRGRGGRRGRRRCGRGRRRGGGSRAGAGRAIRSLAAGGAARGGRDRRPEAGDGQPRRPEDQRPREAPRLAPRASAGDGGSVKSLVSLDSLLSATAALLKPAKKAPFLGTGAFGGPWSVNSD